MSIGLRADIRDSLFHYTDQYTTMMRLGLCFLPLWMASASLSGISMLNSSSIAMTTSTVSNESRPRSFAKCDVPEIYHHQRVFSIFTLRCVPLMRLKPASLLIHGVFSMGVGVVVTYLVEVLQQIHYPSLDLFFREP